MSGAGDTAVMEEYLAPENSSERMIQILMRRSRNYLHWLDNETAYFWAEKAVALAIENYNTSENISPIRPFTKGSWFGPCDKLPAELLRPSFLLARCLIASQQYARCVHFIISNKLHLQSRQFFYYLLYSQVAQKDWANAETSLHDYEMSTVGPYTDELASEAENMPLMVLNSRIEHLKAKVHESVDRKDQAATFYCDAVMMDKCSISSVRAMSQKKLLTKSEIESFLKRLSEHTTQANTAFCTTGTIHEMMKIFKFEFDTYGRQLSINGKNEETKEKDLLISKYSFDYYIYLAKIKLNNYFINDAIILTKKMAYIDPNNSYLLQNYISSLVEVEDSTELFKIAHRLIDTNCEDWLGWYCAGVYYLVIKNYEKAAELLQKSLTKEPTGLVYLALGHAFSQEREHDQAFNAFLMAEKVMRGSALPHLYVGLEYGSTGNHEQAESFLKHANELEPDSPLILQELGTNSFHLKKFQAALQYFFKAIDIVQLNERNDSSNRSSSEISKKWEPLLHNIGSTYRKLGKFEAAITYHKKAMAISPANVNSHCLLGFAYALNGEYHDAADEFQSALSFDRQNQFAVEMLKNVMDEIAKFPVWPFSVSESDSDEDIDEKSGGLTGGAITDDKQSSKDRNWATPTNLMSSTPNFAPATNRPTNRVRRLAPSTSTIRNNVRLDFQALETSLEDDFPSSSSNLNSQDEQTLELESPNDTQKSQEDMSIDDEE